MTDNTALSASAPLSFSFDQSFNVRVVMRDGDPWFVAADVCVALGIVNNRDALEKLDDDERGVGLTDTTEGVKKVGIVNESGLYTLILRCRDATKPGTVPHRFRKWVTSEVIPSIRKTGSYVVPGLADEKSYPYDLEFQVAEVAARMLRMSDTSKIRMLTGICEIKGVSSAFLPASVDETLVRSLTALLKEHRSSLSAKTANIALLDMGLLVEMERKGSRATPSGSRACPSAGCSTDATRPARKIRARHNRSTLLTASRRYWHGSNGRWLAVRCP